ncbi:hypothetical protein [Ammoniphilus sp. YIM 78166]|uniref:hypothetical protein n=1 Tax=Ammoniphilus sp. YIM 78166 TaxID=1644106 RepID=UPI00106FCC20|nr:hypothetical protein [Ammoniphilus sp. YIM 78166]
MVASMAFLGVAMVIALIEVPHLLEKKLKKELCFFSILLVLGVGLSVAVAKGVDLPNPLDWVSFIYKPISDWIFRLLT